MEDLDPPPALSISATDKISYALLRAFENDYTHLTITNPENRALEGYLSIPRLKSQLQEGKLKDTDEVSSAMQRFQRKGRKYRVITMDTPLEELEAFFEGELDGKGGAKQDFAVVTDGSRRFVLGVATKDDLKNFVDRRAK